jgi:Cdc6-like AAA superfamily ATPase
MFRGEQRTFLLEIENGLDEPKTLNISVKGNLSSILAAENRTLRIGVNSSAITQLVASVPENASTGPYDGNIVGTYDNRTVNSSNTILVTNRGIDGLNFDITTLSETVRPGSNVTFRSAINDIEIETPAEVNLTYYLRNSDTNEILREINETRVLEGDVNFQNSFNTDGLDRGSYFIQGVVELDEQSTFETSTIRIDSGFWTPLMTRAAIMLLFTLLVSVGGWKGYQYYWEKRESESRYVFPVDYDRLPAKSEDNYWVGKIAETEKEAYIDPSDLTTHAIVAGSTGSGKSVTADVIAEEALEHDVPVVVFDPTAQWTGFVKELKDDDLKEHYERFGMDPETDPHPYRGVIKSIEDGDPDIDFEDLKNDGEITVFTLNQLSTEEFDEAVRSIIDQIFEKDWEESPDLEMLVIFDEVHRLLEEYGGEGGYKALEKGAREFRKWGVGLMMASQVTADFKQAISGNIMTELQMQTKSMEDIKRVEKKYGEQFSKRISSEDVGTGMIQNSNYNDGDPWFVDFRPTYHNPHKIPDTEMQKYHKLSEKVDKLKDQLEEMKEKGQDVQDKELELQLSENKLKEGRFKMANMYVDSLKDELDME